MPRGQSTEVDAYIYIKKELERLGWDVRNPTRNPKGQVYTQNECLSHKEIQKFLGNEKPENVVKITESTYWVIEAKKEHYQLEKAINEAKDYANKINQGEIIKAKVVSGIAGNPYDTYLIKTEFFTGKNYIPIKINKKDISGFLTPQQAKTIIENNNPNIDDVQIDDKLFMVKAEEINEILHLGAVNPHQRASVMAALLLSVLDDTQPNIDANPMVLVDEINARVKRILTSEGKSEFIDYIKLNLPKTEDNHLKFKKAIVSSLQELRNLNIRSAMNSGSDVLGKFYEVFMKYANWAQDLGIVLTPRHITQFSAEIVNVGINDIVYDPCCGTGGFLVSAFDYVKKNANANQVAKFKGNSLFGVEQDSGIISLAIVNMIFRGDGKNNIREGNCFAQFLTATSKSGVSTANYQNSQSNNPPITKVLMNPPFALKNSDEKEYNFVDYALNQMQDNGILFSVLPSSVMIKGGKPLTWRKEMLKKHTLLAVITFPVDLFYPIAVTSLGIFIKKGVPHPKDQNVYWIRAINDGLMKKKGKRLPSSKIPNDFKTVKLNLKSFILDQQTKIENVPEFQKRAPIDFSDSALELVPEAYLDAKIPEAKKINNEMENLIRESVAYLIKARKEGSFL